MLLVDDDQPEPVERREDRAARPDADPRLPRPQPRPLVVAFAGVVGNFGSLIEAVNFVGSLFYGTLLGCFVLALGFPRVAGTAAFSGMLIGEAAILATARFTDISWLWYNVIGAVVVIATALLISAFVSGSTATIRSTR